MRLFIALILILCTSQFTFAATGKTIAYNVDGASYEGYLASPDPQAPLVILIHDWDGLNSYEIQRADMLFKLGFNVFAADLFGAGIRPVSIDERKKLTGELYQNRGKMRSLLMAAVTAARDNGVKSNKAVAAGYCFGGAAVLEMARSGADLQGFVSFHGGLTTPTGQDYNEVKGKILILHGTADESVSMNDFSSLAQEMEKAQVPHEMITYSGAPHAFTVFGSERYREDADKKSWRRFIEFLEETVR